MTSVALLEHVTFRWYDAANNKSAEFKAGTEKEFGDAASDAAINFRLAAVLKTGEVCQYPQGVLEIKRSEEEGWKSPRLAWNCPPMTMPALGSQANDVRGEHPSDCERIRKLHTVWWRSLNRWLNAMAHQLKAAPCTPTRPSTAGLG